MAVTYVTSVNNDSGKAVTPIDGDDFKGYIGVRPNGNRHVIVQGENLYMSGTSGTKVTAQANTVQDSVNTQAQTVANHMKMLRLEETGSGSDGDFKMYVNSPCPLN